MPIQIHADTRRMNQQEFGRIAYDVMDHAFAVHNEMGRFFDENIYRDAVAGRIARSQTEVLVEVRFEDFRKDYYLDLLVDGGAVFELKTVRALGPAQRSQLLNYLLLAELPHGKLVNFRPELVGHEFVNTSLTLADRIRFDVNDCEWSETDTCAGPLAPWVVRLLRDIGAGLDLNLYEDAITHFLGGEERVWQNVDVLDGPGRLGTQKLRLAGPGRTFKVTAINSTGRPRFEEHARRFLNHTSLHGIQWINITRKNVMFRTIEK